MAHKEYLKMGIAELLKPLRKQRNNVVVDVKSVLSPDSLPGSVQVLETLGRRWLGGWSNS